MNYHYNLLLLLSLLMSLGSITVVAVDVRNVTSPFRSLLLAVVYQMQCFIRPLPDVICPPLWRSAVPFPPIHHSQDQSLDRPTVLLWANVAEQPKLPLHDHATYGTSCLLLAFLSPTTCHLSNLRSINLI